MAQIEKIPHLREEKRKKNTNRALLTLLFLFFIVMLLILFFRSSISKLQEITVTGNQYVTKEEVIKNSGLAYQMQFLFIDKEKVAKSILAALPAIEKVDVSKQFPGKVELLVKERRQVALIMEKDGHLYPITDNGVELKGRQIFAEMGDKPIVRSWDQPALLPQLAEELTKVNPAVDQLISEIRLASQKDEMGRLVLYMKDGYEVHTTLQNFSQYMEWYPSFVESLKKEGKTEGIINLSEVKYFEPYPQQPAQPHGKPQQQSDNQAKSP
ncbi:cell division protein FtsQ/DivIB [Aneurinibacillus terranovensis]|uniref:cell division protein FtsQ/DivIB n=1 Tax=Aneurinibacillus terranovensis TaxID=278991 RepID=UPI00041827ED|nr:FtsQ-type POTRA domain-containing protein [Aneurinibacillus terranovensis]